MTSKPTANSVQSVVMDIVLTWSKIIARSFIFYFFIFFHIKRIKNVTQSTASSPIIFIQVKILVWEESSYFSHNPCKILCLKIALFMLWSKMSEKVVDHFSIRVHKYTAFYMYRCKWFWYMYVFASLVQTTGSMQLNICNLVFFWHTLTSQINHQSGMKNQVTFLYKSQLLMRFS